MGDFWVKLLPASLNLLGEHIKYITHHFFEMIDKAYGWVEKEELEWIIFGVIHDLP